MRDFSSGLRFLLCTSLQLCSLCLMYSIYYHENIFFYQFSHHIIKKHLKFVDPFKKKDFAEKYFERSLEEVKRAIAKAM